MRPTPLLALALLLVGPASASTYDALWPNDPCTITLDANGISAPTGFLPTPCITQWFTGGEESYNAGAKQPDRWPDLWRSGRLQGRQNG